MPAYFTYYQRAVSFFVARFAAGYRMLVPK